MFTAQGTLRYSPKRQSSDQHWWLVLDCDPEIGEYYRHLYHQQHYQTRKLARPFWGAHITILRNEEPQDAYKHLWFKHAGERITFNYRAGVCDNYSLLRYRSFYWLDVICPRFDKLRVELGLLPVSEAWRGNTDYHLTIGSYENPDRKEWYEKNFKGK